MLSIFKNILLGLITLAMITMYTLREFFTTQPIHHQFNAAGGVLLVALLLVYFFFPRNEDDEW